ncbi:DALR anticodon-binding domain-containing protein [Streptomyces sp. NBC_00249]|uniref:ArgS-related anticodon-binding protein NrtL n=1 Tax=Streptomyces sp. NBC_00249 TaxID=2975690 RepID=UPI0022534F87|nr:DALR anticodon-binding domain-containing protein [Streptomyces sp. NBC_00249]MCX5194369.1 DALR anticodon-binding domain-containing protein [Streptomyces sp. NBC_00249]
MIPVDLSRAVVHAVRRAVEDGELAGPVPARVVVERTRPGGVGEYATPVAFQLAKGGQGTPGDVARVLARRLGGEAGITRVDVTGPGFLNFTLMPLPAAALVGDVLRLGPRYGYAEPAPGFRERAVREAVTRILWTQGTDNAGEQPRIAPVAQRDGDVVAVYGAGAATWAVLAVPARETPAFTPGLLAQDESSEYFRVRYAHSRCRALTRNAELLGFRAGPAEVGEEPLLRLLADHPLVLEAAAHHRAPERLVRHLVAVADALLDFQHHVLPQGDEKPSAAHRARLALAEAAGTVLAGGLALLGIDAPDFL